MQTAKFKSAFNIILLLYSFMGIWFFTAISLIFYNSTLGMILTYLISVSLFYATMHFQVNSFYIYIDRIEVHYFFRLFNRVIIHKYDEIVSIEYHNHVSEHIPPTIQLIFSNTKRKIMLPSNSFPVFFLKKRKAILKFFNAKGIPIEIKSYRNRDDDILS